MDCNNVKSLAFFVYHVLRFPRNNREYFLTKELLTRGYTITWLLPKSGVNEGVPVDAHLYRYDDLNVWGRTYLLPLYLGAFLRAKGVHFLWLSGWSIRSRKEIYWLVKIIRMFGIKVIYDPIDPIYEFEVANKDITRPSELAACRKQINEIYALCSNVLCVTPEMKALLHRNGADLQRLFVARWGVDTNIFDRKAVNSNFRKAYSIREDKVLIGWLGSMTEFKGLKEMIIPLMERLSQDRRFHFLIAGDGPLYDELQSWLDSQQSDSITLAGRIPYVNAADFTAALDMYLVTTDPSTDYAMAICPIKCYDAVALGTPLITTRTPATEHLLHISKHVFLCDYHIESFEQAILDIAREIEYFRNNPDTIAAEIVSHQKVSIEIADMLAAM